MYSVVKFVALLAIGLAALLSVSLFYPETQRSTISPHHLRLRQDA